MTYKLSLYFPFFIVCLKSGPKSGLQYCCVLEIMKEKFLVEQLYS